jgi:radical SAM protein (TIGR01212 family)
MRDYEVWMEYGLQSIHDKSLKYINRGHSYQDFLEALNLTRKRKGIKICAHIILGLPGETRKDIMATAKELGRLKLDGVKIHPLHIIKGTKLEEQFKKGLYTPLQFEEYTGLVGKFLEYLCPDTVIQRLAADCPKELLAAPDWILQKSRVLEEIDRVLIKEGRFQGKML